jgi:hypothetical protein
MNDDSSNSSSNSSGSGSGSSSGSGSDRDRDSNSDSDINDHQLQEEDVEEEEEDEETAAAAAAAADKRLLELISLLQRKKTYSTRIRNKIDDLVEPFLTAIKDDIHNMICYDDPERNFYGGLDSDIDTEDEIEATARIFPDVLLRKTNYIVGRFPYYPIQMILSLNCHQCNLKAVLYIPLLIRLAIEFGSFDEELRGGLLVLDNRGNNVLHNLMLTDSVPDDQDQDDNDDNDYDQEHHESVDDKYLLVLMKLRQMSCFKKEDIRTYGLLNKLCIQFVFPEKRIRFLVEWDPTILLHATNDNGFLPLHYAAGNTTANSIQAFRSVFEYGIRYYPKKKGICLLFRKYHIDCCRTPFEMACDRHGRDDVMKVIEDTLLEYQRSYIDTTEPLNNDGVDALITAAIDENIHLDCVYFLMRRQPDVLVKLLSQSQSQSQSLSSVVAVSASINDNDDDDDINITSKDNDDIISSRIKNNKNSRSSRSSRNSSSDNVDNGAMNEGLMINNTYPKKLKRKEIGS